MGQRRTARPLKTEDGAARRSDGSRVLKHWVAPLGAGALSAIKYSHMATVAALPSGVLVVALWAPRRKGTPPLAVRPLAVRRGPSFKMPRHFRATRSAKSFKAYCFVF